jgi:hypothetical protein
LHHSRTLTHFDSFIIILKARVLELEKIISIYQTNIGEFERIKFKLSKSKGENIILNVQIQTLKIKNRALKTSGELSNITILNLKLV